jgi:hypothetical protein
MAMPKGASLAIRGGGIWNNPAFIRLELHFTHA